MVVVMVGEAVIGLIERMAELVVERKVQIFFVMEDGNHTALEILLDVEMAALIHRVVAAMGSQDPRLASIRDMELEELNLVEEVVASTAEDMESEDIHLEEAAECLHDDFDVVSMSFVCESAIPSTSGNLVNVLPQPG